MAAVSTPLSPRCSSQGGRAGAAAFTSVSTPGWGIGLIVTGMSHLGFTVSLGEHGVGRLIAAFFHGRGRHEPIAAAGQTKCEAHATERAND